MKRLFLLLNIVAVFSICPLFAQVGINTENPQNMLHVVGDGENSPVRIDNVQNVNVVPSISDSVYLVIDEVTGNISKKNIETAAPFYYITYKLENVDQDWVSNFNTNIPIDKYTVVVVGSAFNQILELARGNGWTNALSSIDVFASHEAYAFKVDPANPLNSYNEWRIRADYQGADTDNGRNGTWIINCLVLVNSQVTDRGNVTVAFGGSNTASAPGSPVP